MDKNNTCLSFINDFIKTIINKKLIITPINILFIIIHREKTKYERYYLGKTRIGYTGI